VGALLAGLLWTGLALAQDKPADSPIRVVAQIVLKVANKDKAQQSVITEAERLGGYFFQLSEGQVAVRVPVGKTDALLTHLDGLGLIADRQYRAEDLRERLEDQKTLLKARQKVLDQYFKLLDTANAKAVITVEREITRLIAEVERYQGGIRLLEHDAKLARVSVSFQFRDRTQPNQRQKSSFDWLNSLSLASLVRHGAIVQDVKGPKNKVRVGSPEGFAAYETKKQHWSASPDGVLFRVRTAEHKPVAGLAFWAESMAKHLDKAGYRIHSKSEIKAGTTAGHQIETHAPMGAHDYAYTVALFPDGKRLVIVEVAGPVEKYDARRAAVTAAIGALKF
jgi:hypothetical protein